MKNISMSTFLSLICALWALLITSPVVAQDITPDREDVSAPKAEYSPYAGDHFPNRVYFGDTHLHTSWSAESGMIGGTLGPDLAYRISRLVGGLFHTRTSTYRCNS